MFETDNRRYIKFVAEKLGGHYHIQVRAGSRTSYTNSSLPLCAQSHDFIMGEEDWEALRKILRVPHPDVVMLIEERDASPDPN